MANLKVRLSSFNYYNEQVYYRELPMVGKRRHILCSNPEKFLEERVCAHVLICVLRYLLNRTVEYLMRKAGLADLTVAGLYEELAWFDACEMEIKSFGLREYKIAEATLRMRNIAKILLSEDLLNKEVLTS